MQCRCTIIIVIIGDLRPRFSSSGRQVILGLVYVPIDMSTVPSYRPLSLQAVATAMMSVLVRCSSYCRPLLLVGSVAIRSDRFMK
jgi:hypothetical protein